jgi:hypothetical protein
LILLAQTRKAERDKAHHEADALPRAALAHESAERQAVAAAQTAQRFRVLLFFLLVETAGLALFALAFVVAAGVAFFGGFAAGVAFLGAFMVLGVSSGRGAETAQGEGGEDELEGFHTRDSSFLPKVDASDCGAMIFPSCR